MSFRRYIAGTVREAMDRVRRELGDDAVILSNKRLGPGRVEIVAAASDSMEALVEQADRPQASARTPARTREREDEKAMGSTESFQEYLRRKAATPAPALRAREASTALPSPGPASASPARARPAAASVAASAAPMAAVARTERTQHAIVGEVYSELSEEVPEPRTARGRIACIAHHFSERADELIDVVWHLRYDDEYELTDSGWRITTYCLTFKYRWWALRALSMRCGHSMLPAV